MFTAFDLKSLKRHLWHFPIWGFVIFLILLGAYDFVGSGRSRGEQLRQIYSAPPETWPKAFVDHDVDYIELAPADFPEVPKQDSLEALEIALGERLFKDPLLSQSGHISCQSCHNEAFGWGDGLRHSFGHARRQGTRNAPSLFASWARSTFFWDGRADSLAIQMIEPLTSEHEMANHDLSDVPYRLKWVPDYPQSFERVYGDPDITLERIGLALSAFQKHLDRPTALDRFLSGDHDRLTDQQIEGLHLFRTKARCVNCHMGPALMDGKFHKIGLSYYQTKYHDLGRYEITGNPDDAGAFSTPSLRHLSRSGPYMHNGLFPSLDGIVNLYNAGGARQGDQPERAERDPMFLPATEVDPLLRPLNLTREERAALVEFLKAL